MQSEWYYTDDYQICRKIDQTTYEFIEFNQVDDLMISSNDTVDLSKYKDSKGEWTLEAQRILEAYYRNIYEFRELVLPEDEDQVVAECIFESTSQYDDTSKEMTQEEAESYLDAIICGKITDY